MYKVEFRSRAVQDLDKLDDEVARRVLTKIRWLGENFESIQPESLVGGFAGLFKLRAGDHRIIYLPDRERNVLTILLVGHRREVYE
jgi:mRNA interferase RelE/StbE